ncbi:hypothetical protein CWS72_06515 [Telmatospirillum siberiense]|uniref:Uncharacterized protein n=2 Tax=Telmatospirillum siberiense TaxID=382514 RepID=A0A2N3PXX2_9PROT|nr:hypothetical protein CWS72_06515 [Telmatospirillum siberiense]
MLPGLADVPHADTDRIWVTRDGRYLRLGEMSTDHLRNAMTMLERNADQRRRIAVGDGLTKDGGRAPEGTGLPDPAEAVRRDEMAAAMKRVIASRSGRPSKAGWFPRLS